MKKGLLVLVSAIILLFGGINANAQDATIKINGEVLKTKTAPINIDGRILIPLRDVGEALQCEVLWNDANKAVSLSDGNDICIMWIGKDTLFKFTNAAISDGYISDVMPQLINEKTMIPIRCISELMGAEVNWIDEEKTVTINYTPNPTEAAKEAAELGSFFIDIFSADVYEAYRDYVGARENVLKAEIELEGGEIIKLDLFPNLAPISVENFYYLAVNNAFDNTVFHRVIKDFMIQGGAFDTEGNYYSDLQPIPGEFIANNYLNFIPHKRGAISMARTNEPDSATCQFFIVHKDSEFLNTNYATFGEVTEGMEYVDKIAEVETDENDCPIENQIIKTIRILNGEEQK